MTPCTVGVVVDKVNKKSLRQCESDDCFKTATWFIEGFFYCDICAHISLTKLMAAMIEYDLEQTRQRLLTYGSDQLYEKVMTKRFHNATNGRHLLYDGTRRRSGQEIIDLERR